MVNSFYNTNIVSNRTVLSITSTSITLFMAVIFVALSELFLNKEYSEHIFVYISL